MRGGVQQNIASSGKLAVLDQAAPDREKNYEKELARLSRLYATLSQVTHTIMWAASREELFEKVCRVLVEKGAFHMGWIGRFDRVTHEIARESETSRVGTTLSRRADGRARGRAQQCRLDYVYTC